jgi:hypothetical protein
LSFIYIASPYSDPDEKVRHARYTKAGYYLVRLLRERRWAYSPIVHCHEIARMHRLPTDAAFWAEYNFQMLEVAAELHVLQIEGWERSVGVAHEVAYARNRGKKILMIGWGTPDERKKLTSVS